MAFLIVAFGSGIATAGISYVSARNAVLQSTQDHVMNEFLDRVREIASESPQLDADSMGNFATSLSESTVVIYHDNETSEEIHREAGAMLREEVPPELRNAVRTGRRVYFQRAMGDEGPPFLYVGTAVLVAGEPSGIEVYQRFSQLEQQESLDGLLDDAVVALAVSGVSALLLALLAARSVLRPVRQLSHGAKRLGEGALDTRLPVRGADELAELVVSFNSAAAALERSIDQLRREEANSRRFVADVSHELRTPLAAMTAVTETLDAEAARLGGDGAMAARVLSAETHRLAELVESLIEISRFDSGQATLVLEELELTELVRHALDARGWLAHVDVTTVATTPQHGVVIMGDPRRLDVIIANLVGNALRHGEPPVTVTVFAAEELDDAGSGAVSGHWVGVAVADSGPGLDTQVVSHVFDRFYKSDRARSRSDGSGLGLAIAQENARLHRGHIKVTSSPDQGTTFTLIVPVDPLSEPDPREEES